MEQLFSDSYLRSHGLFVTVFSQGGSTDTYIVDCTVYLTDTNEDGSPALPFCISPSDSLRDDEGDCVCCKANPKDVKERVLKRGSILCPLCNSPTAPWSLISRHFRGIFKVIPGKPAEIQPNGIVPDGYKPMTDLQQIQLISEALC